MRLLIISFADPPKDLYFSADEEILSTSANWTLSTISSLSNDTNNQNSLLDALGIFTIYISQEFWIVQVYGTGL